jgi:hypothetical protein
VHQQRATQAAEIERRRLDVSREASARAERSIDRRATRERLEALKTKSDSLREQAHAMTARDDARRLAEAAARVKAERKDGSR